MITRNECDVAEVDIVDVGFIAELDGDTPGTGADSAALETDVVDVLRGFRADFHAGVLGFEHAVLYADIRGRTVVRRLPRGLYHDSVVAANNVAVADFYVPAVVGIDAVAVRNVQQVADLQVIYKHALAADHVQPPLRRIAEGDVVNLKILAGGQHEHFRPERGRQPPLVLFVVAVHELLRPAVDLAGSRYFQAVCFAGGDYAGACIVGLVGADHQFRVVGEVKIYAAFQVRGCQ